MFEYLLILFLSPVIFLFLVTVPQYLWSLFQRPKLNANVNELYSKNPEIAFLQKKKQDQPETEILVRNFRNTQYFSSEWDNKVSWENKKFKLEDLEFIEILVDHFGFLQSHIVLIFNFIDGFGFGKRLCVSFEPKKKHPKDFIAAETIYRNFETGYIVGSYEDLVWVRYYRYTNFNKKPPNQEKLTSGIENLSIYKANFTKFECQQIFLSLAKDVNLYSIKPSYYHFIYRNCLSEILKHLKVTGKFKFHYYQLLFLRRLLELNSTIASK